MLEGYVGAEAWRAGVRRYIQRHAYGNTVSDDLWRAIEAAAGKPITAIAHDFTLQPGVPLITVGEATCSGGASRVTPDPGRVQQGPAGQEAAGLAGAGDPAVGGRRRAGAHAGDRRQGGRRRARMRPGDRERRPERLLPDALRARRSSRASSTRFAAVAVHRSARDPDRQLGARPRRPAAGHRTCSTSPRPRRRTPIRRSGARSRTSSAGIDEYARGDAPRRAAFRTFAIARLAPVFATIGWTARPGEPAPVAILRDDLIETLGVLGDPARGRRGAAPLRRAGLRSGGDSRPPAQDDPRRGGAPRRRGDLGPAARGGASPRRRRWSRTTCTRCCRPPRTRPWPAARSTWP